MKRLAVAGTGYVGLVAGVCFAQVGHDVTCVDVDRDKIALLSGGTCPIYEKGLEELLRSNLASGRLRFTTDAASAYAGKDAIFIGVGTPERPDGSAEMKYIASVARQIAQCIDRDCLVVVKSTVPVGTNDKVEQYIRDCLAGPYTVEVASNPEFLAQGNAVADTLHAPRIILGTESASADQLLREIYEPFQLPIISVRRRSAEMIKYACNDFLALKISYMNDIANLCELVGADVTEVAQGMRYDSRIGDRFLNAGVGYGGSCFPKDTKALSYLAAEHGYRLRTVEAAVDVNSAQKQRLMEKAAKRLISLDGLRTAVLGLTFKAGTDDLREAPALDNVERLVSQNADLICYDPVGGPGFHALYPSVPLASSPEEALSGAMCCFIFTEWQQIRALAPEDFVRWMKTPLVFDGRNLFDPEQMRACGVEYHCIGRERP